MFPFTLSQNHVRVGLGVVTVLSAAALTAVLLREQGAGPVPPGLWAVFVAALALLGVVVPLVTLLTPLSRPSSLVPALVLLLAGLVQATFLNDRLGGFPVTVLCAVGVLVSLATGIVVLFNALDLRRRGTAGRSRLS
ncbi:hypothetical protein [Kocuria dechangensis]|uniref:hypothetical protein n=1 Tax=Kocuria dechangensis TaxID=1176249 RepID=UPI001663FA53|nr:hypothetical protein [Kocuria dechangensis]